MKRIHIHVGVEDLDKSIRFYNALLGAQPIKTKSDYAKWMLNDPRLNFAISIRPGKTGVDHLGIQVDEDSTLDKLRERFKSADMSVYDEGETVCCYARSDKTWVKDPSGVAWETYKTMEDVDLFSGAVATEDRAIRAAATNGQQNCCESPEKAVGCCG